jgi:hypothetical protein
VLSLLVLLAVALAACHGCAGLPCANGDFGWGVEIEFKGGKWQGNSSGYLSGWGHYPRTSPLGPLGASLECRRV